MKDAEFYGQHIPEGSVLELCLGPANRDPSRWDNPDAFDLHREKLTNMAFGLGTHRCLGMNVARVEIETGINALLDEFPNLRLDPDAEGAVHHRRAGTAGAFGAAGVAALKSELIERHSKDSAFGPCRRYILSHYVVTRIDRVRRAVVEQGIDNWRRVTGVALDLSCQRPPSA